MAISKEEIGAMIMAALEPLYKDAIQEEIAELPSEPVAANLEATESNLQDRDDIGTNLADSGEKGIESATNVPTVMDDTTPLEAAAEQIVTLENDVDITPVRNTDLLLNSIEARLQTHEEKQAELLATIEILKQENETLKGHFSTLNSAVVPVEDESLDYPGYDVLINRIR